MRIYGFTSVLCDIPKKLIAFFLRILVSFCPHAQKCAEFSVYHPEIKETKAYIRGKQRNVDARRQKALKKNLFYTIS